MLINYTNLIQNTYTLLHQHSSERHPNYSQGIDTATGQDVSGVMWLGMPGSLSAVIMIHLNILGIGRDKEKLQFH